MAVALVAAVSGTHYSAPTMALTGFLLSYHVHSTWRDTHGKQNDLQKVGLIFSWMFLPAANLLCYLFVLTMLSVTDLYTLSTEKQIGKELCFFSTEWIKRKEYLFRQVHFHLASRRNTNRKIC